jgi:dTDP-4-amino-4,6-dideoxygalactose transaminase
MISPELEVPFNDLRRAVSLEKLEILKAIEEFLDSGSYILGTNHQSFESELASYVGVSSAIGCANGTDAIQLALRAVGVVPGDQVLTAANAGGYATTAINLIGGEPVFADVDPLTHLLTLETITKAIQDENLTLKAIVVTHLFGAAARIEEIYNWAKPRGIYVVEDCAQSLGALAGDYKTGSLSDVATTSFYPTKNLGALGDGGATLTNNPIIAKKIKELRQYGWSTKYKTETAGGTNSRLDELQASILRIRLRNLDQVNERRRQIHARYESASKNIRFVNSSSSAFVAHLAVLEAENRDEVVKFLKVRGVATDVHYPIPDHLQSIRQGFRKWNLPVTEGLSKRVLSIPLFPELREDEIAIVESALRDF